MTNVRDKINANPQGEGRSNDDVLRCDECGCPNPVWFAPSDVWNLVVGGPDATDDPGGVLCPICFIAKAEAAGVKPNGWRIEPEGRSNGAGEDALRKALRPFANAAKWWKAFDGQHRITTLHQHGDCLEVGHLRAAEAALSAPQGDDKAIMKELRPSKETMEKIDRIARANAAGMAALRDMPLGSAAPQGEVERLREARNAALEEAATVAIHNSNFGHVEGNKRAFKIADQILGRKDVQPEAGGEHE